MLSCNSTAALFFDPRQLSIGRRAFAYLTGVRVNKASGDEFPGRPPSHTT